MKMIEFQSCRGVGKREVNCFFYHCLVLMKDLFWLALFPWGRVLSHAIKMDLGAECQDRATQGGGGVGQRELSVIEAVGSAWLTSSTLTYFHIAIFFLILKQDYTQETGRQACLIYLRVISLTSQAAFTLFYNKMHFPLGLHLLSFSAVITAVRF